MGKGSGTTQRNVKKPKVSHVAGDGGGVSSFDGGTRDSETSSNLCLFSLSLKIKFTSGEDPRAVRGDAVTLARLNTDEIGIFVGNKRFSSYSGAQKTRLLECMAKGYVYSGQVQSVGANTLRATVRGGVLRHESLPAA